ncbi:MAG TPA: ribosome biogenesis GTP-binding protein YihA/YsxC [Puia sp.]|nr:ribosome biogenesis GTP-binding protein YihA/YsxC [Puia sp.]
MIIRSSKYLISSPDYKACPKPDRPEYAFIGRSNVGKSSLINMICNHDHLAKTSGSPGKTQLINHFEIESILSSAQKNKIERWYIVDLPGYGFAKVSQSQRKKWQRMIEDYLRKRENLVNVFLLIDSRHSPQKIDIDFVSQLGEWQVPFCLIFTKADKENQRTVNSNVKSFLGKMKESWQFLPRHIITSAVKKTGREKILELIEEINLQPLKGR